ncbi:MAG: hypothetical protein WA623_04390 [Candidatus Sulfotelmatobacter sp.]
MTALESKYVGSRLRKQRGYVLLALLLAVSLLVITAAAAAPSIASQIRRDRETELIRRGMQYRRAIRRFAKQTGRFPLTLADLENTNGIRYLRKRYKDPLTGKDFRLLHMADIPAATGTSASAWSLQPAPSSNGDTDSSTSPAAQDPASIAAAPGSQSSADKPASQSTSLFGDPAASSANNGFSGGVIVGVASTSKKKTIREFDHRDHYNQWLFFYDPGFDRPFEVQGPTPLTRAPTIMPNVPNASAAPGSSDSTGGFSGQNAQPVSPQQ